MTKLAPTAVKFGINILAVLFVLFLNSALHAQIGINVPANESPQAQLDIRQGANNLPGMLIPKVSSLPQASAGETIAEGLLVFLQGENPNFYVFVNGEWQTIAESSGVDITPPTVPQNLAASNPTSSRIDLNWDASSDNSGTVTGYKIYDNSDDSLVATVTGGITSATISGLTSNTSYTFYATAYDAAGNESDPSNTATETTTEITGVTINEGYFETGWDGWEDGGSKAKRKRDSNLACEQQWSVEIKHNKSDSNIELRNVDLTDYTVVTVDFQYKTNNWNSLNDYFTFKLNGAVLGSFYESQTCTSASITINSSDYSFGNGDDFKFEGEMSDGGEKVYIDAVVIKGYTQPTATVCETSFEDDYGCWERDNNSTVWRGDWYSNTGQGHLYFQSDDLNNSSNFDNSYISTAAPIDASEFSAGMIQMWYSGNGNTEDENDNGTDYLRLQYYNGSGWSNFPEGSYGVQPSSYEFLSYSIPADYLTNNLRIRIKFDATTPNERLFVDDTVIQFY